MHSASACIDRKNPKLAFYCRNQKFGSILEEENHSQHFLKPRNALIFVLLSAVFTLFSNLAQGKNTFRFIALVVVNATGFFLHIVFILHVKLIFHQNFPMALTTTSTINRNAFFPYAKLQKLEKRVKTAQSRSKNKLLLGFKKKLGRVSPFQNTSKFLISAIKSQFWIFSYLNIQALSMHDPHSGGTVLCKPC